MVFEDMTAKQDLLTSLPEHTREKDIFNVLWALLKRKNCRSPINFCNIATKVKSLFDLENSALGDRGVTRGAKRKQFPGIRITVGDAGKSQQCHK